MALQRSPVERCPEAHVLDDVDVEALFEERAHDVFVAVGCGPVERGAAGA